MDYSVLWWIGILSTLVASKPPDDCHVTDSTMSYLNVDKVSNIFASLSIVYSVFPQLDGNI